MFSLNLNYPSFEEEVKVVNQTTSIQHHESKIIFDSDSILRFQTLIRKIPVVDNIINYAVSLSSKSRPKDDNASELIKNYVSWGAGPRASQNLILAAKTNAVFNGKFSPDIEDVQAVAKSVLRHRIIKNYKAEAENITIDSIIESLF
jgi:MoxR-like ATPase